MFFENESNQQILWILVIYFLGMATAYVFYRFKKAQSRPSGQPVYGVFCGEINDPIVFREYQKIAIPLAEAAGLEVVASTDKPIVLEGEWPFKGSIAIERFSSIQALNQYRHSPEYQRAMAIRDQSATVECAIVVQGELE